MRVADISSSNNSRRKEWDVRSQNALNSISLYELLTAIKFSKYFSTTTGRLPPFPNVKVKFVRLSFENSHQLPTFFPAFVSTHDSAAAIGGHRRKIVACKLVPLHLFHSYQSSERQQRLRRRRRRHRHCLIPIAGTGHSVSDPSLSLWVLAASTTQVYKSVLEKKMLWNSKIPTGCTKAKAITAHRCSPTKSFHVPEAETNTTQSRSSYVFDLMLIRSLAT